MARLDWKNKGKFNTDYEVDKQYEAMEGWSDGYGDWIAYYRLDTSKNQYDPVYLEAINSGRAWYPALSVECLHVTHIRGANENGNYGFNYNDDVEAIISFDQYLKAGMILADVDTGRYEQDRVVYDQKAFRVQQITISGKIQERPTLVAISATQLKPWELRDDEFWSQFANEPTP